ERERNGSTALPSRLAAGESGEFLPAASRWRCSLASRAPPLDHVIQVNVPWLISPSLTGARRMQPQNAPGVRWEWIGEAWQLFTRQWSVWVLMILALYLIVFAIELPFIGIIGMLAPSLPQGDEIPPAPVFPIGLFVLYPALYLAIFSAVSWLTGGLYHAALKQ